MEENNLKRFWLEASNEQTVEINAEKLIDSINKKMAHMNKRVKSRDFQEISIAVFLIPIFSWWLIVVPKVLSKIGAVIIIVNCILVIIKLIRAKKVNVKKNEASSEIKYGLIVSLQLVKKQINLHSTILWWYLLPFFVGAVCIFYGFANSVLTNVIYTLILAVLYWCIWYMNTKTIKKHLKPLEENLSKALNELSE